MTGYFETKPRASLAPLVAAGAALLLAGIPTPGRAAGPAIGTGTSPAVCGAGDVREPGIQGDVPAGQTANYNCGVKLVGQLPLVGNVQGVGKCAYVRTRNTVHVIDVSDPAQPLEVRTIPVLYGSETMRVVVTSQRAVLVSGSSVYDIRDCLNPVLKGEIKWPPLAIGISPPLGGGGGTGILPHDLRINRAATKVYGSMGLWEADISNLDDPATWKITDFRCDLAIQVPGPWQGVHQQARKFGIDLCEDAAKPSANFRMGGSSFQATLFWPTLSHSPDVSGDDKRVYIADQAGGVSGKMLGGQPKLHIVDITQRPVKVLGVVNGPGHGLDWFRVGRREYVLHSNEIGTAGFGGMGGLGGVANAARISSLASSAMVDASDTCRPYPRPTALGWAFDVVVSDVTNPTRPRNLTQLRIAINDPVNCAARKASGRDPTVAYHLIDNPLNPHFAAVNFGSAGLRIFDIRQPANPAEVAYFNHGPLVHGGVGYYDAARGLVYAAGSTGFWVLELEPQVKARLRL